MSTTPPPDYRAQRQQWREQQYAARMQQRAARDQQRLEWRAQREQMKAEWRLQYGRRRGSILGPLFLIGLGVLFLMTSMDRINGYRFWQWFGQWWPLLLVGAGVVLLAEWGIDEYHHQKNPEAPTVRRGIGGGVVFLLVMLVLAGSAASGTRNVNWDWVRGHIGNNYNDDDNMAEWFGEQHDTDETLTYDLAKGAGVSIEDPHGDVIVTGTSSDGKVHLQLHKTVYVSNSGADALFKELEPLTTPSSSNLDIRIPQIDAGRVGITATVPVNTIVFAKTGRGAIHISGIKGAVTATDDRGDVALDGITGDVVVHTKQGGDFAAHDIHGNLSLGGNLNNATIENIEGSVILDGNFGNEVHVQQVHGAYHYHSSRTMLEVERVNGNVDLNGDGVSGADIAGPVELTTKSRNVELQRVSGAVTIKDSNANIDLTSQQPLSYVDITTSKGHIDLTVPMHSNFDVDAQADDGDVDHDFTDAGLHTEHMNRSSIVNGKVGAGGVQLRLRTTHDNIMLHRSVNLGEMQPKVPGVPKVPSVPMVPRVRTAPANTGAL